MYQKIICTLTLLFAVAGSAYAGEAELSLMECMRSNIPPTLRIQDFELSSVDRTGGKRQLRGRLFAKREENLLRASIRLTAPADLNGASYLMREGRTSDEMYVYLPALARVRRIQGAGGDGPLFGTDISYADIKQLNNAFSGAAPKIEKTEMLDGRLTQVLSVVPAKEAGSRFQRVRAWVDKTSCIALKAEFMEGSVVRKRFTAPASALSQSGKFWYLGELTMEDLKLGTRTSLKVTGVKSGEDVASRFFDARNFYIGN